MAKSGWKGQICHSQPHNQRPGYVAVKGADGRDWVGRNRLRPCLGEMRRIKTTREGLSIERMGDEADHELRVVFVSEVEELKDFSSDSSSVLTEVVLCPV
jgi:hypothetical protein